MLLMNTLLHIGQLSHHCNIVMVEHLGQELLQHHGLSGELLQVRALHQQCLVAQ